MSKTYRVNEIFYSLQGEGVRAGIPHVFVRFSGCNQRCRRETHRFDCDTEFVSGADMDLDSVRAEVLAIGLGCRWLLLTGGEPGLHVDPEFINYFHDYGYSLAIETNGSIALPDGLDWVTVKRFADVTVTDLVSVALLVTMGSRSPRNTSF